MGDDSRPPATGYPVHSYPPPQQPPPATGTAYPYPQQPPQHPNPYFNNNNNYPYQNQQQTFYVDHQRTAYIRRLIVGMMASLVIFGCILFILWLILRPKFPDFTVESGTVTGFNLSNSSVSGAWDFRVSVFNPNKKVNIVFEEIESNLAYKSNSIADNTLAPFTQGKMDSTSMRVAFAANGAYLRDKAVVALTGDRSADGVVGFDVRIYSRVYFDAGIWRIRRRLLRVLCDNVMISVPAAGAGNMTGGARSCRVGW